MASRTTRAELTALLVQLCKSMGHHVLISPREAKHFASWGAEYQAVICTAPRDGWRLGALTLTHEAGLWRVRRVHGGGAQSDWGPACTTMREMAIALRMAWDAVHTYAGQRDRGEAR